MWYTKDSWVHECESKVRVVNDFVPTSPPTNPILLVDGCRWKGGGVPRAISIQPRL